MYAPQNKIDLFLTRDRHFMYCIFVHALWLNLRFCTQVLRFIEISFLKFDNY